MSVIGVLLFLLFLAICILIFWIPPIIAEGRSISESNLATVRLLTILGVFFGITWIVALVLACVYPPEAKRPIRTNFIRPKSFDPIPESFMREEDPNLEEVLGQPKLNLDKCENCGQVIGKLETPSVWNDHVICGECYEKLTKQKRAPV